MVSLGERVSKLFLLADFDLYVLPAFERCGALGEYQHCWTEGKGCFYDAHEEEVDCSCACRGCDSLRALRREWDAVREQLKK